MSTYGSQLKGWAVDRVIQLRGKAGETINVDEVTKDAQKLVDFCFVKEEARADLERQLHELDNAEKLAAAIAMEPASNKVVQ